jgi:hypothetical protein
MKWIFVSRESSITKLQTSVHVIVATNCSRNNRGSVTFVLEQINELMSAQLNSIKINVHIGVLYIQRDTRVARNVKSAATQNKRGPIQRSVSPLCENLIRTPTVIGVFL